MASGFNVNNNANLFNNMFGTTATGGSSPLSEYAMIRSGAYKKLLNAYYDENRADKTEGKTEETPQQKEEKTALMSIKSAASDLKDAANALSSATGEDRLEKAKSFVKAYNTLLDNTENLENTRVLQKTLWMIGDVKANDGLLEKAGIKIGADNKLTLEEEKFKKAEGYITDTLFSGRNSVVGKIAGKTFDIVNRATEALTKLKGGSVYTDKGDYTKLNTSTLYDKLF